MTKCSKYQSQTETPIYSVLWVCFIMVCVKCIQGFLSGATEKSSSCHDKTFHPVIRKWVSLISTPMMKRTAIAGSPREKDWSCDKDELLNGLELAITKEIQGKKIPIKHTVVGVGECVNLLSSCRYCKARRSLVEASWKGLQYGFQDTK